jgi:acrylyl-CoA reductase (NADPH)
VGTFKAIRIDKAEKGTTATLTQFDEAELMEGDVTVRVEWSTINYKDGLALTGKAPVVRRFPMIAGIDFAGTVEQSSHPQWKAGDKVVCNGWGMGETHLGAYAEKARVKGDWLVRCLKAFPREMPWRSVPQVTRRCSPCWRWKSTALTRRAVQSW